MRAGIIARADTICVLVVTTCVTDGVVLIIAVVGRCIVGGEDAHTIVMAIVVVGTAVVQLVRVGTALVGQPIIAVIPIPPMMDAV